MIHPTAPMRAGYYAQLLRQAPQLRIISHWRNGVRITWRKQLRIFSAPHPSLRSG